MAYKPLVLGPNARSILAQYARDHKPGQHVLINGDTGSGKTELARYACMPRMAAGAFVILFVTKPTPDATITGGFNGWTRWKRWPTNWRGKLRDPTLNERRILLWPDVKGMTVKQAVRHMRVVMEEALNNLYMNPGWTIIFDEALYMCDPKFLNLGDIWGVMNYQGRSMGNTLITNTQRPKHLPLIVYTSCDYAFVGRVNENADLQRVSELNKAYGRRDMEQLLGSMGKHDFAYVHKAAVGDSLPPVLNLTR